MILSSNPKELIKSIKKDIASIRRGRKFISYYEAFDYADKIEDIADSILLMVEDEKVASQLFKELILTDSKVYLRSDDSAGAIQTSYAKAEDGWIGCLSVLSDEEIYADIMEMLVCEGFGVRGIFSEKIPKSVLEKIYEEFHASMKWGKSDSFDTIHVLHLTAHYLRDPERYITASKLNRDPLLDTDMMDIAKEYQYAQDADGVLVLLNEIKIIDGYMADDFYGLQVWAYKALGQQLNMTLAYKNWYDMGKKPSILKKYLARLDGAMQTKVKNQALQDAQKLGFSEALQFFYSLDEKALASTYIEVHQKMLQTEHMYSDGLKKITNWLKDEYPQEATLLYRDSCEKALITSTSKYYPGAIKSLKECIKLENENDTLSWHIEENSLYMAKLLEKHKRKRKFVELFLKAFGDK